MFFLIPQEISKSQKNKPDAFENKGDSTQTSEETEDIKSTSDGGLGLTAQFAPSEKSENENKSVKKGKKASKLVKKQKMIMENEVGWKEEVDFI